MGALALTVILAAVLMGVSTTLKSHLLADQPGSIVILGRDYQLSGNIIDRDTPLEMCVSADDGRYERRSLLSVAKQALGELQATARVRLPITIRSATCSFGIEGDGTSVLAWSPLEGAAGEAFIYGGSSVKEADVAIDPEFAACLVPTIAHELGHILGLDHQGAEDNSMMSHYCRGPSDRDGEALRALYGE